MKVKANNSGEDSVAAGDILNESPNVLLAEEISDALTSAGLVPANRKAELLSKLKMGGVKQEDWGLWVDVATTPKKTEGKECE